MNSLQARIAYLLVKMTFVPGAVLSCPTCPAGYFMVKNCSTTEGIQCKACTNCSALHQVILSLCTPWTDAVCGNQTVTMVTMMAENTPEPAVSSPEMMIIVSVISGSVILILALVLMLLARRYKQNKGLYLA